METAPADHLSDETILALVQAALPQLQQDAAELHLSACEDCGAYLAAVARALTTAAEVPSREKAVAETRSMGPGAPASPRRVLPRGAAVGRYTVLGLRGVGAMGVVYAAYNPQLDRKVALKLLHHRARSDDASGPSDRLLQEARVMARLSHPNVVTVFDAGLWNDEVFVALEYVEGRTLRAWLADGRRHWREVLDVFLLAGEGLAFAHRAGVVHRDFKPENVLIGMDGSVQVTDFGLAGIVQAGAVPAAAVLYTAAVGTPRYVAPEQKAGTAVEERADQFSFCVALHEALTGTLPQLADLAERGPDLKLAAPPEGPVPSGILRVLRRGLEADPKARYPGMGALLADVRSRRRPKGPWLTAAAVLGACVFAAVGVQRQAARRQIETCSAGLGEVWSPTRKERIKRAFDAAGVSDAALVFARVDPSIDRFASAWSVQRRSACEWAADHSDAEGELRLQCLDRQLEHLRAMIEAFESAEQPTVRGARHAATTLPLPKACNDPRELARSEPLRAVWSREDAQSIVKALAKARATMLAGNMPKALEISRNAARAAHEANLPALEAEALFHVGVQQRQLIDPAAFSTLVDALAMASGAGYGNLEAVVLDELVVAAVELRGLEEASWWLRLAESATARAGTEADRARSLAVQGYFWSTKAERTQSPADFQRAIDVLQRANEILATAHDGYTPRAALVGQQLGVALYSVGRHDEGLDALQNTLRSCRAEFGDTSFASTSAWSWVVTLLVDQGRYADGLALALELFAVDEATLGRDHPSTLMNEIVIVEALKGLGRYPEALDRLGDMQKRLGNDSEASARPRALTLFHLGDTLRLQGHAARALAPLHEAVRVATSHTDGGALLSSDAPKLLASIRLAMAQSKQALGAPAAEWQPLANQAVKELEASGGMALRQLQTARRWLAGVEQRGR